MAVSKRQLRGSPLQGMTVDNVHSWKGNWLHFFTNIHGSHTGRRRSKSITTVPNCYGKGVGVGVGVGFSVGVRIDIIIVVWV